MSSYKPTGEQRVRECIQRGRKAAEHWQTEAACPFGGTEIGERCAWLAGFRDRQKELDDEM